MYPFCFLKEYMVALFNNQIDLYDGNNGTIRNLKNTLEALNLLSSFKKSTVLILNSGGEYLVKRSWLLYNS